METSELEQEQRATAEQPEGAASAGEPQPSAAEQELLQLRQERDQLYDRLARLQAEFDNFRKRSSREQSDHREYALADAVKSLLPVLDNFDLALRAGGDAEQLRKGVELIRRQMEDTLTRLGVQPVKAKGEPFDPHQHEAIEVVESAEVPENHVLEELRRGYRMKERLLRPAMVRVARGGNKEQ